MTLDRFLSNVAFGPTLLAACLGISMATTLPATAQGGGGSSAAGAADDRGSPGSPAAAGQGSGGRQGEVQPSPAGTGPRPGLAADVPPPHQQLEQARAAGVAAPPEQRREQLQDLNEIARRLAPSVPVPAPGLEGAEPSR